jgi:hypothetical protein
MHNILMFAHEFLLLHFLCNSFPFQAFAKWNERRYGLEPMSKLSIGSKIAKELVGKLLADLCAMRCV